MIRRFVHDHALRLILVAGLAAINAGAGFVTFSAIGTLATDRISLATVIQATLLLLTLIGSAIFTQTLSAKLGADFVTVLRKHLAERLLTYPYVPTSRNSTHGLSAFINDISEIAPLALTAPLFIYNGLFAAVAAAYLFYVSIPLAILVIAQMIVLMSLSAVLLRPITPAFDRLRAADDELYSGIYALKSGRKELLTSRHRSIHFHEHVITPAIERTSALLKIAHSHAGHFAAWSSSMFYVIIIATVLISNLFFRIEKAEFMSFMVGCLLLVGPSNYLLSVAQQVSRGFAAVRRIERFSSGGALPPRDADSLPTPEWQTLSLHDVKYVYDDPADEGREIGPLNLSISRGELIFAVGGNGSGKSTLLLMLSGLLDPTEGSIRLDGVDMIEVKQAYREQLSIVFCDFHIFDHVLDSAGNLAPTTSTQPRILELGLADVIEVRDGKLSRTEASAGQRKRIALLQLMLEDRDVLILDEAAADLDPEFKHYFYREMLSRFKAAGKTIILATHDAEYFACADRVVYMQDGRLIAEQSANNALNSAPAQ
ncbi:ATP-binding cassette domain-containing protein [Sphingomonas sanguinis]|uniref:Cyclic peptide transporter n=1 Tax=Sphingomonas sanguinis TaxID=33051 RepID=A0A147HT24_9SPHN|nr:ATP-binding cassette domain-containing protein [Sphingomonas sanguinis]KTT67954.1 hypothetical protein NS319_16185 [Sphingomonas sanguinis]